GPRVARRSRGQAGARPAGGLVESTLQRRRVGDARVVHVGPEVAVVGHHALAPRRLAAGPGQDLAPDQAARHRDHLDRQREPAQHVDLRGRVDDADECLAGLGDDLLAGQRRAAALDQAAPWIAFVGTVDVQRQRAGGIEVEDLDAEPAQLLRALLRARYRVGYAVADPAQCVDEVGHRRAGADADNHAVLDEFDGLLAGQALGFGHVRFPGVSVGWRRPVSPGGPGRAWPGAAENG